VIIGNQITIVHDEKTVSVRPVEIIAAKG
jgi:hypothetical protein